MLHAAIFNGYPPMRYFDLKTNEWQRGRDRFRGGDGDWIEYPQSRFELIEKYAGLVHSCILWEANPYRTLRNTAWMTEAGANGCQTLFDDLPDTLAAYAEGQCAWIAITRAIPGYEYDNWIAPKPTRYDKEFFDTNSGSWMIASYVGLNPEFGIKIEVPEADYRKGVNWIDKLKTNPTDEMSHLRGRTRR